MVVWVRLGGLQHLEAADVGDLTEHDLWENLEYFLERVIPVAEEAGMIGPLWLMLITLWLMLLLFGKRNKAELLLAASVLTGIIDDAIGHILTASIISVPAALMIADILIPSREATGADDAVELQGQYRSSVDAVTRGTVDAIPLCLNIIAMLVVFVALVTIANQLLGLLPEIDDAPLTLQRLLGWLMAVIC